MGSIRPFEYQNLVRPFLRLRTTEVPSRERPIGLESCPVRAPEVLTPLRIPRHSSSDPFLNPIGDRRCRAVTAGVFRLGLRCRRLVGGAPERSAAAYRLLRHEGSGMRRAAGPAAPTTRTQRATDPAVRSWGCGARRWYDRCLALRTRLRWWAGFRFEFDRDDPPRRPGKFSSAGDYQPTSRIDHNHVDHNYVDNDD